MNRCIHPAFLTPGLSDEEFWALVYPQPTAEDEYEAFIDEILRETWVIHCVRCGRHVEVDEETRHTCERDAFCDDCADEMLPDAE